jgi:hypothetical protein
LFVDNVSGKNKDNLIINVAKHIRIVTIKMVGRDEVSGEM